ncbi:MAG: hypothetical protein V4580_00905 [Bacteroidota bacterium]
MFNFFNKKPKNNITSKVLANLRKVCDGLKYNYVYLLPQISSDFIIGKKINGYGDKGAYTLILNQLLEEKFRNKGSPLFIIKNINIIDSKNEKYVLEFHVFEGILVGYYCSIELDELIVNSVTILNIYEKHFINHDKNRLLKMVSNVGEKQVKQMDLENSFCISIENKNYYTIKSIGNGDYLTVDDNLDLFSLHHDPFEIKKISETLHNIDLSKI